MSISPGAMAVQIVLEKVLSNNVNRVVCGCHDDVKCTAESIGAPDLLQRVLEAAVEAATKVLADFDLRQQEVDFHPTARRQANGLIKLSGSGLPTLLLGEGIAQDLRDQLDVALHVPAPDQRIDPPSRL